MKWTIVIPTWKRAKALAVLLGELAGQSTTDFEVVVVSDGEDAHTRKLAETFAGTFSIRWIFHAENRGLAAAEGRDDRRYLAVSQGLRLLRFGR